MTWLAAWLLPLAWAAEPAPLVDSVRVSREPPAWMAGALDSLAGAPLAEDRTHRALEEAVSRAERRGFLLARASADSLDSAGVLHVSAQSGRRFVWDGVRDRGTSRLTPRALTRISRLPSGADADPRRMESARRRILSTGYVEEASEATIAQVPRTAAVRIFPCNP